MRSERIKIEQLIVRCVAIVAAMTASVFVAFGWKWALLALIGTPIAMVAGFFFMLLLCAIVS